MKYRKFRMELVIGMIIVAVMGWILHYVYKWTGNAFLVGLFVPVNESVWEHMKLVYVPMLILSVVMMTRWGEELPPVTPAFLTGTFVGTWLIPVLFYTYRGIVGRGFPVADMATFFVSLIITFFFILHMVKRCMDDSLMITRIAAGVLIIIQGVLFLWFTYNPPGIGLFAAP